MKPHYINVQPMHAHVFYSFLNGMNTGGLIVGSGSPNFHIPDTYRSFEDLGEPLLAVLEVRPDYPRTHLCEVDFPHP